ncbi:MAG: diaminopimelate epimerase [Phycisphaerales bacterium]
MHPITFVKVHGLGNDYILLDAIDPSAPPPHPESMPALARAICDRRRGVGADGLLVLTPGDPQESDAALTIHNSDGSPGGVCGTGIRCAAAHLVRQGIHDRDEPIRIDVGPRIVRAAVLSERRDQDPLAPMSVRVEMGALAFEPEKIPVDPDRIERRADGLVSIRLDAMAGLSDARLGSVQGVLVSVGNPHFVCPLGEANPTLTPGDIAALGASLSRHPAFIEGVNVHIVSTVHPASASPTGEAHEDELHAVTCERGAGVVLACTTGACAIAGAMWKQRRTAPSTLVRSPGGVMRVNIRNDAEGATALVEGEAVEVFRGHWQHRQPPDNPR